MISLDVEVNNLSGLPFPMAARLVGLSSSSGYSEISGQISKCEVPGPGAPCVRVFQCVHPDVGVPATNQA